MSFGRSKRTTRETPSSVSSRAQKRIRGNEEPIDAPEPLSTGQGFVDVYVYLVKLAYANFQHSMTEHASSLVNGKQLDLSVSSLNSLASAPNTGKKFFDPMVGWAATEKKKQGLPYGMFFTHMFHVFEVEMTGEVQEKPKDSKEYNKKTLRLMGFVQNDDGEWVKKEFLDASSHEPCLSELEASMAELKEEQKKMTASMQAGFEDIKKLLAIHPEHFRTLDKDIRGLKHQVNNNIHVASMVIQNTIDEFKATSIALLTLVKKSAVEVVHATEVHMNADRNLRPHVLKWTYWFSITLDGMAEEV
ncbi:hypothetical protein CJ030_MR2G016455 [Morella rubra]|uniref:Uncharacterized protein n=1 Tax=Morella rubra TaxID=262757 RepID=A0A6A1WCX6_9ROSI|nr:hypothetical protein CJ030_MR2G016455 [Morella rubra]